MNFEVSLVSTEVLENLQKASEASYANTYLAFLRDQERSEKLVAEYEALDETARKEAEVVYLDVMAGRTTSEEVLKDNSQEVKEAYTLYAQVERDRKAIETATLTLDFYKKQIETFISLTNEKNGKNS